MMADKEGYDQTVTIYSPEGRIFQAEYARIASERGGAAIAVLVKDRVLIAAVKGRRSKLMRMERFEKIHRVQDDILATTSGLIADARVIVDYARNIAFWYKCTYGEEPDLSSMIPEIQKLLWMYTEYGMVRPFGVSAMFVGPKGGRMCITSLDVTGTSQDHRACCIGMGSESIREALEERYRPDLELEEARTMLLAILEENVEDLSDHELEILSISGSDIERLPTDA